MSEEIVYTEWEDGRGNLNRVTSQDYKGRQVIHLRRYWQPNGEGTDWVPTRVGLMIRNEAEFREVMTALDAAGRELAW